MGLLVFVSAAFVLFGALASVGFALLYLRGLKIPTTAPQARVTVILPATGPSPGLEDMIADLAAQTLSPRRIIIAVESKRDPAYERVRSVQATTLRPTIDLVIAGHAKNCGQKNANILAALKALGPEDEYILFLDADVRPQPWYVASLFESLVDGRYDLVNAYRWLTPTGDSAFAALIAALDRRLGVLPRLAWTRLIWGGSIALTPCALAALDLEKTLAGEVLDDLPIGSRAAAVGLRIWPRRSARALTPLDGEPRRLAAFARRQLQLVRLYRPQLWTAALLIAIADLCARVLLVAAAASQTPRLSGALAALIALAGLDWVSAELRLYASRRLGVVDTRPFRRFNRAFALTLLPLPIAWAALLCASFFASKIAWAHIRYDVDRKGRVLRIERDDHARRDAVAAGDCLHPAEGS